MKPLRIRLAHSVTLLGLVLLVWGQVVKGDTLRVCQRADPNFQADYEWLIDAVAAAGNGDRILVCQGPHTESDISIESKRIDIEGDGAGATIQAAVNRNDAKVGVFWVDHASVTFSKLNIRFGRATGHEGWSDGGAIHIAESEVELRNCDLTENFATRSGGAVHMRYGKLTVIDSEFTQNEAKVGAAIAVGPLDGLTAGADAELHVSNSTLASNIAGTLGGAIYARSSPVYLKDKTRVIHNEAGVQGGGVYFHPGVAGAIRDGRPGSPLEINDVIVSDNHAGQDGGGLFVADGTRQLRDPRNPVQVIESAFTDNTAQTGGGAAVRRGNRVDIHGSRFVDNKARKTGGGLWIKSSEAVIRDTTFHHNEAPRFGSGIDSSRSDLFVRRSTLSNNVSHSTGAGLFSSGGLAHLTNSTVSGNVSPGRGGGIQNAGGSLILIHATVAFNEPYGLDILGGSQGGPGHVEITNSIVAENFEQDCIGIPEALHFNLDSDASCEGFSHSAKNADLSLLDNFGGRTATHALLPASEAIDEAHDPVCQVEPVNAEDQRRESRPKGPHCDLGAYETEGEPPQEEFSVTIQPNGNGNASVTGPNGTCMIENGVATGDACQDSYSTNETPVLNIAAAPGTLLESVIGCADTVVLDPQVEVDCEVEGTAGQDVSIELTIRLYYVVTVKSHPESTGTGHVHANLPGAFLVDLDCVIKPSGAVSGDCSASYVEGAELTLEAVANPDSQVFFWEDCDSHFVEADGSSAACFLTVNGNRIVTVKIDEKTVPDAGAKVVATIDQTSCDGDFPGFNRLRFLNGVLLALARTFDEFSNVFQCLIRVDVNTGEDPTQVLQNGDIGVFGIVDFISQIGLFNPEVAIAHIRETLADDTTVEVLGSIINGFFEHFMWQGLSFNPTVESFDKIAANDPYFVIQAQFQAEGPGLVAADIAVDPALLAVVFQAGDSVGDGFAFDSFHAGAVPGIALNPLGDGAVVADIVDTTSGAVVDGLLTFRADTPGANLLLRQGQETELPGVFISRLVNVAMDGDGVIAVLGRVFGTDISSVNDEAVWVCIAAICDIVVQEGMEPEGMPGVRLRFPGSPVVRDGKLLMRTVLEGTGIDSTNNFGLLLVDLATGAVELVGQKGDAFAGDTIADFTSKAFSNNIPLVTVRLNGGFGRALARVEAGGLVPEIVPGDEFTLPDGTVGIVSGVLDIPETGGEDGRASAVGGGGYAIIVVFQDGRQGIVACTATCLEGGG